MCQPQVRLSCAEKQRALVDDRPKVFSSALELVVLKPMPIGAAVRPGCNERANNS